MTRTALIAALTLAATLVVTAEQAAAWSFGQNNNSSGVSTLDLGSSRVSGGSGVNLGPGR